MFEKLIQFVKRASPAKGIKYHPKDHCASINCHLCWNKRVDDINYADFVSIRCNNWKMFNCKIRQLVVIFSCSPQWLVFH